MARRPYGPWVTVLEDGSLWLCEGQDADARRLTLSLVEREDLKRRLPRLHGALVMSDNRDAPRIVRAP
jgi:hypothetical protein